MKRLFKVFSNRPLIILAITLLLPASPSFAGRVRADINLYLGPGIGFYYRDPYPAYRYPPRVEYYYDYPPAYYYAPPPPPPRRYWRSHGRHHNYDRDRHYRRHDYDGRGRGHGRRHYRDDRW
jgi:hypothetical protein